MGQVELAELACSPCDPSGAPAAMVQNMNVMLIGYSKYCTVSVNDCVSLYLRPVMTWRFVQGEPRLSPYASWERLQLPHEPSKDDR